MSVANVHDAAALEAFFRAQRIDLHRLKRWRYLMYHEGRPWPQLLAEIPAAHRAAFVEQFRRTANELVARHDSHLDSSSKLVFRTPAGLQFETVILRASPTRTSLCVSSQVGCAARCRFCATGYMPSVRDLREDEILDQVAQGAELVRDESRRLRNVVFMGMGEPLHNEQAVSGAVEKLQSQAYFGLSPQRILVSSVGVPDALERFARRFPLTGIAISLHSARQDFREQLIPLARRVPLTRLRTALERVNQLQKRPLMIEYLMLEDANDTLDDARLLADYLDGLWVHINLIPFNPIAQLTTYRATPRARRDGFAAALRSRGYLVTVRYSQGADIGAACGQLIQSPLLATGSVLRGQPQ